MRCDWRQCLPFATDIEPRTLNLTQLAEERHGVSWNDLTGLQQVEIIRWALRPRSFLIDPSTPYMQKWDNIITFALLYTSFVTPFEVAFITADDPVLFVFNRSIDILFVKDMLMQFFLVTRVRSKEGTFWIRDQKQIALNYIRGWFSIDLVSVIPFGLIGELFQSEGFKKAKVLRMIRLIRLIKLVRILRASRIIERMQNNISITFASQALLKCFLVCIVASHWLACLWGLTGTMLAADMECDRGPGKGPYGQPVFETSPGHVGKSWVVVLFDGGKLSPDNPCDPWAVYAASLHFSVMSLTSIGYGDITPMRFEEYLVCICCMFGGGFTWAYLIGSFCGVVANLDPYRVDFERNMDALNYMLKDQEISEELRWRLRDYFREAQHLQRIKKYKGIRGMLSESLANELLEKSTAQWVRCVSYFNTESCTKPFLVAVTKKLTPMLFAKSEPMDLVDKLFVIERGLAARAGRVLCAGAACGDDFIVSDASLRDRRSVVCLTFCDVHQLLRDDLMEILEQIEYADEADHIRQAAIRIALRHAFILHAKTEQERAPKTHNTDGSERRPITARFRGRETLVHAGLIDRLAAEVGGQTKLRGGASSKSLNSISLADASTTLGKTQTLRSEIQDPQPAMNPQVSPCEELTSQQAVRVDSSAPERLEVIDRRLSEVSELLCSVLDSQKRFDGALGADLLSALRESQSRTEEAIVQRRSHNAQARRRSAGATNEGESRGPSTPADSNMQLPGIPGSPREERAVSLS